MSVVRHFRNYASAGLIGSLLGLITFPLLARSLSVADYGLLGLVMSTVTLFVALGKMGLQHSLVRFFSAEQEKGPEYLKAMLATTSAALLLLSLVCTVIWIGYSIFIVPSISSSTGATALFLTATFLVPIKMLSSGAQNILKANEDSGVNATASVVEKIVRLLLIAGCLTTIGLHVTTVITVAIVTELVLFAIVLHSAWPFLKGMVPRLKILTLTPLIVFGLPSMAGEIIGLLLEVGDRYVIDHYLGAEPLGFYSAAYNLTMYLQWVLIVPLHASMVPHYFRMYEQKGEAATIDFVSSALRSYVLVGVGIAAIFCALAPELLTILAGERYLEGQTIVPWVVAALFVGGGVHLSAAGCFIYKKPIMLVKWTLIAFVLNIILNILTVPEYGVVAAAIATFICYVVRAVGLNRDSSRLLHIPMHWDSVAKSLICGLLAWALSAQIDIQLPLLSLLVKVAVACAVYMSCLAVISSAFRQLLVQGSSMVKLQVKGA